MNIEWKDVKGAPYSASADARLIGVMTITDKRETEILVFHTEGERWVSYENLRTALEIVQDISPKSLREKPGDLCNIHADELAAMQGYLNRLRGSVSPFEGNIRQYRAKLGVVRGLSRRSEKRAWRGGAGRVLSELEKVLKKRDSYKGKKGQEPKSSEPPKAPTRPAYHNLTRRDMFELALKHQDAIHIGGIWRDSPWRGALIHIGQHPLEDIRKYLRIHDADLAGESADWIARHTTTWAAVKGAEALKLTAHGAFRFVVACERDPDEGHRFRVGKVLFRAPLLRDPTLRFYDALTGEELSVADMATYAELEKQAEGNTQMSVGCYARMQEQEVRGHLIYPFMQGDFVAFLTLDLYPVLRGLGFPEGNTLFSVIDAAAGDMKFIFEYRATIRNSADVKMIRTLYGGKLKGIGLSQYPELHVVYRPGVQALIDYLAEVDYQAAVDFWKATKKAMPDLTVPAIIEPEVETKITEGPEPAADQEPFAVPQDSPDVLNADDLPSTEPTYLRSPEPEEGEPEEGEPEIPEEDEPEEKVEEVEAEEEPKLEEEAVEEYTDIPDVLEATDELIEFFTGLKTADLTDITTLACVSLTLFKYQLRTGVDPIAVLKNFRIPTSV